MRLGCVNYETKGKIAILTLDGPGKLNALSTGICEGVLDGFALRPVAPPSERAKAEQTQSADV